MDFGPIIQRLAFTAVLLATYVLAGPEYVLDETVDFHVQRGEQFTIKGYYKYCRQSTSCPSCIRQLYLNLFNKSTCLKEKITFSDLDCKKHLFSRIFTAPNMAGIYNIKMEETLDYRCKNNRKSNSGRKVGTVTIKESRPILTHRISTNDAHLLYQNDSVKFTVFLNHDALSGDNAWNVLLVWILPYYAVFKSHEPETNITSPHPGEYHIGLGQIEMEASVEVNITVQIDPGSRLSLGRHFLSIPTHTIYEQQKASNASGVFVGSVKPITVNFTVKECGKRSFLLHPVVDEVYFCSSKTSDLEPSCFMSIDGFRWIGIDPRVELVTGIIVRGLYKKIYARSSDDRCHVVSYDNLIWRCVALEQWRSDSSSNEFSSAIFIPRDLTSKVPQIDFVASTSNGTVSYGGSARGLHKKEKNGIWRLVASWACS